jgi:hypothetical protein
VTRALPALLLVAPLAAAIGCSSKGSKGSQDSTSDEEIIDTVGEELPVDTHDIVAEEPPVDAHDTVAGEEPSGDGCDQDLPGIIEEYASYCGESPSEHCTNAGCGDCQVCSADVVCSPPSADAYPDCECCGDGECYDLCGDDGDCAEGSACRLIGWFEAYDDYTQLLRICWPSDDPAGSICP